MLFQTFVPNTNQQKKVLQKIKELEKGFIFLAGIPGTGKTHLLIAKGLEVLNKNIETALAIRTGELLKIITDTFDTQNAKARENIMRICADVDYLGLDDIGVEKSSEFTINTLFSLIDTRMINNKKTIFTSNLTQRELQGKLGDRLISRILSGQNYLLDGKDYRTMNERR